MKYETPSQIPSESFVTGNQRILATVKTGQLTTDRLMGLAGIFGPTKHHRSIINSSRVTLLVEGQWREPFDSDERTTILSRGYVEGTNIIRATWDADGVHVEDQYFVPPDQDVVIHRIHLHNTSKESRTIRLFAILSPHLGGGAEYKKGSCKQAFYDEQTGAAYLEDHAGNVLAYALNQHATAWQVGQVCGQSDVHFDLEDHQLSNVSRQENAVVHIALERDLSRLAPDSHVTLHLVVGRFSDLASAQAGVQQFRDTHEQALQKTLQSWKQWSQKESFKLDLPSLSPRFAALDRMSRVMLKTHQTQQGVIVVGSTCRDYQGAIAARNGCFCLRTLDRLGYHDEAAQGLGFFTQFKMGDDRFCSPDENDQLGTIIHCLRLHHDLTGDQAYLSTNYPSIRQFANAIIDLIDPQWGLIYSERAIHEFVAIERGYETYVNVMAFRGLSDAAVLANEMGMTEDAVRFAEYARRIRIAVLNKLYCPQQQTFTKRIYQGKRVTMPAISMLTPALFGLIDANDARVTSTIKFVRQHLWDATMGGLYRYPLQYQPWDEIPYGGPWVTYTCWLARIYVLRGELEQAHACLKWVVDHVPADSHLVPEHFSVAHMNRRGFHRIYYEPVLAESWATSEFLFACMDYQAALSERAGQTSNQHRPQLVPTAG